MSCVSCPPCRRGGSRARGHAQRRGATGGSGPPAQRAARAPARADRHRRAQHVEGERAAREARACTRRGEHGTQAEAGPARGGPRRREAPGSLGPARRAAVAAAGPVAHLVVGAMFAVPLRVELLTSGIDLGGFVTLSQRSAQGILAALLLQGFFINIALFIYN